MTIAKIAELAGVSVATVSRVLNQTGRYSEETKRKILEIIEEHNYRTNNVAKSLRTHQSKTIGIIIPDITNEFFSSIVLAVENYCVPRGYSVFVCNTSENIDKEKLYLEDLDAKGVDGLIYISGYGEIPGHVRLPSVCIDRRQKNNNSIIIESDNFQGGFLATEELISQGCQRILLLKDERDYIAPMEGRFQGYMSALRKYGLTYDPSLNIPMNISVEASQEAVSNAIKKGIKFDGIFATTDWLALGSLYALREHGIEVPKQVKIVGFDNISAGKYSYPALTTINQDKTKLGELAASSLLELIQNRKFQRSYVVPVELIRRKTTC
ncbi:LacI family DNA-binding transcriptional regulator [Paenibacillus senegalensis]|uniref:LacI family DNA-binding transcriptional regulator n=1 Tax=Paenibacillus senegalensis TaxID=1465766 RepID=UPI0005A97FA6|nr:LacI family DNA-binding transcriptional regulator [Paenibacillus senegalensis]